MRGFRVGTLDEATQGKARQLFKLSNFQTCIFQTFKLANVSNFQSLNYFKLSNFQSLKKLGPAEVWKFSNLESLKVWKFESLKKSNCERLKV